MTDHSFPSETQLREWWRKEVEFSRTELGHLFLYLKERCQYLERERDHYRKCVMEWAEVQIDPDIVSDAIKPRKEPS